MVDPIAYVTVVGVASLCWIILMTICRAFETPRTIKCPDLKGWKRHREDVKVIRDSFSEFLKTRSASDLVSLQRSANGVADSNRTITPVYKSSCRKIDVSSLTGIIHIDRAKNLMHVEPGVAMDELASIATAHGVVPQVVLEFPGITAGGALSGGGIESSSHRYGSFFDTIEEIDVITGDGNFLSSVSRTNFPDLFHSLCTSFGTQGIVTRIAVRIHEAKPFVHVHYIHVSSIEQATEAMEKLSNDKSVDFLDGVVLSPISAMIVVGTYSASVTDSKFCTLRKNRTDPWFFWHVTDIARKHAPVPLAKLSGSDWRRHSSVDQFITIDDYLFRFDRGAFWMARHGLKLFYGTAAYNPSPDERAGPSSILRYKYSWLASTRQLYRMLHKLGDDVVARLYVVQDFIMPGKKEASTLVNFMTEHDVDIWPLWLCPVRTVEEKHAANAGFGFPVQATKKDQMMFNVGVYGRPNPAKDWETVDFNRMLESFVSKNNGRKMLYAQSFYSTDEFWALFDKKSYDEMRSKFGGKTVFPDIASKLLLGESRMSKMRGKMISSFDVFNASLWGWYFSLWAEILFPRFLHASIGIQNTSMTRYSRTEQ